jgi:hypothetical protein
MTSPKKKKEGDEQRKKKEKGKIKKARLFPFLPRSH